MRERAKKTSQALCKDEDKPIAPRLQEKGGVHTSDLVVAGQCNDQFNPA